MLLTARSTLNAAGTDSDAKDLAMRNAAVHQQWSVEITDVQGRLSNLYLWPGTLTRACLKCMEVLRRVEGVVRSVFVQFK